MAAADYLADEALIVARLKLKTTGFGNNVLNAADLAGVEQTKQITPAVFVIYIGDRLGKEAGRGIGQEVFQQWAVVVAVRNARSQRTGEGARSDAGPLMTEVIAALQGWEPATGRRPLKRIQAPWRPKYSPGGYAEFPLAFETELNTLGTG